MGKKDDEGKAPEDDNKPEDDETGEDETNDETDQNENSESDDEWKTQLAELKQTITDLSAKLSAVEGRADHGPAVTALQNELKEARAELAALKEAKPEPKPKPKPPTRKQSLAKNLERKGGDDRPAAERAPRRKLAKI